MLTTIPWAADASPPSVPARQIWLRAVGDIMLDRGVARGYQQHDLYVLFDGVRHLLTPADIAFGNLECPISRRGKRGRKRVILRADPTVVMALEHAGFDVLALGNNHSTDYGSEALQDTVDFVERRGMVTVGAEPWRPGAVKHRLVKKNGLTIAFLSYMPWGPKQWTNDAAAMPAHVLAAKGQADFVVASFHWGDEYVRQPSEAQKQIARGAVAAGVDLVIGHHPHVTQGVEVVDNVLVAYSLGNFLFDLRRKNTQDGLLLDWQVDELGNVQIELLPTLILLDPPRTTVPLGGEGDRILSEVAALSKELGTELEHIPGRALRLTLPGLPGPRLSRREAKADHLPASSGPAMRLEPNK